MRSLVFLLCWLTACGVGAAEITKLRVWHAPDQTRFVFDLSAPTTFTVFPVADPHRVVIDLSNVSSRQRLKLPPGVAERVRGLRQGRTAAGGMRVVLDLEHAVKVRQILLPPRAPYGHRLVVDVIDPSGFVRKPAPAVATAGAGLRTKPDGSMTSTTRRCP